MCGIVGYVGDRKKTVNVLLDGLTRLEYRGYDSSGIALMEGGHTRIFKSTGKLSNLKKKIGKHTLEGLLGIGHTRWATHGDATEKNAHPHVSGGTSVVHNGIIENYSLLKGDLIKKGYEFYSDTDTEYGASDREPLQRYRIQTPGPRSGGSKGRTREPSYPTGCPIR
jgi:glucosamine--fructose-6-phosphate aminotransferase (isomerizing)